MSKDPERRAIETNLCVGGPADGKRYAHEGRTLMMAAAEPVLGTPVRYVREAIAGETLAFEIWRFEALTIDETLARLIEAYRP